MSVRFGNQLLMINVVKSFREVSEEHTYLSESLHQRIYTICQSLSFNNAEHLILSYSHSNTPRTSALDRDISGSAIIAHIFFLRWEDLV